MRIYDADAVEAALDPVRLVTALRDAFRTDMSVPLRHHHYIQLGDETSDATLLMMPVWSGTTPPHYISIKAVTVHPGNPVRSLPSM